MRVVIDTNLLLSSLSTRSSSHWLYQGIFDGTFELCVTTEILDEYAEIITWGYRQRGLEVADAVLEAILNSPYVRLVTVYYGWPLIYNDPDDNKLVDCAIAASAVCIVTEDGHFDVLKTIGFPSVQALNLAQFRFLLDESQNRLQ